MRVTCYTRQGEEGEEGRGVQVHIMKVPCRKLSNEVCRRCSTACILMLPHSLHLPVSFPSLSLSLAASLPLLLLWLTSCDASPVGVNAMSKAVSSKAERAENAQQKSCSVLRRVTLTLHTRVCIGGCVCVRQSAASLPFPLLGACPSFLFDRPLCCTRVRPKVC